LGLFYKIPVIFNGSRSSVQQGYPVYFTPFSFDLDHTGSPQKPATAKYHDLVEHSGIITDLFGLLAVSIFFQTF
jgi:hypothetical protein